MYSQKYDEKFTKLCMLEWIIHNYPLCTIALEVPFLGHQRRIDILVITENNQLIVFELKSKQDQLNKLIGQLLDYTSSFQFIYIATDPKFQTQISQMSLSQSVGQLLVNIYQEVKIVKPAVLSMDFNIYNMLTILKKNELLSILGYSKLKIHELRLVFIEQFTTKEILKHIAIILKHRYTKQNKLFYTYRSEKLTYEDLIYLNHSFHLHYLSTMLKYN